MRVFRAIVEALVLAVLYFRHDLAPGGSVGAEFVGDHALGRTTLLAQKPLQQPFGGSRIAADLDDFVEHVSVLIDGAPEVAFFAVDRDHHFVEMPDVLSARLPLGDRLLVDAIPLGEGSLTMLYCSTHRLSRAGVVTLTTELG